MKLYNGNGSMIEVSEKTDMVSAYPARKISIIGDSISTYDAPGYKIDGYAMTYPTSDVQSVEQTWWKKVIDASGAELNVNASYAGSRVTNAISAPDFYARCGLLGNPDMVMVALGTNDYDLTPSQYGEYDFETPYEQLDESKFRPAYIKGVKALMANYPGVEIVLIILYMVEGMEEIANSIKEIGSRMNLRVVDTRPYSKFDNAHPNAYGMRQIASRVMFSQL